MFQNSRQIRQVRKGLILSNIQNSSVRCSERLEIWLVTNLLRYTQKFIRGSATILYACLAQILILHWGNATMSALTAPLVTNLIVMKEKLRRQDTNALQRDCQSHVRNAR